MLQRVAVWCSVLQYAAACCSVLQRVYVFTYTYTHTFIYPCHPLYDKFMCICISKYIYTLQHTATRCNRLQHTATRCNTYTHVIHYMTNVCVYVYVNTYTRCNTPQHAATYCNTHCNTLQHVYPGHSLYVCPRGNAPFSTGSRKRRCLAPFKSLRVLQRLAVCCSVSLSRKGRDLFPSRNPPVSHFESPKSPYDRLNYTSLLQNIVSFIGLFCKRDL